MKKMMYVALTTLVMSFTSGNHFTAHTPHGSNPPSTQENGLFNYTWYWDIEGEYPTGTTGPIGQEVVRLSMLYPNYSWSSNPFGGAHQYEYGYFLYYYAQIWTNKP
ncbi:hypothetical protein [Paraflavitalea sp. CAU 1676]|uniref:hypothetical protein n=1 Tax=Paraflavitalea sp. CAU 1676 TaxID=3032598 RepID=UPI0023DAFCE3|nr:hypothetical protein [Paraflavitalea sp. CAU 1676]MDF2192595.1 hypothetical protein [Paraflavitalea sp. CAU 1676]